ncbi:MAG: sensor histidine kinase [Pseudomonadota bacterium]
MTRLSITARLALLAVALGFAPALVLTGFLWHQTHDDTISGLRRAQTEQRDALSALYRTGGRVAVEQVLADRADADDEALIAEVVDSEGVRRTGIGPDRLVFRPEPIEFRIGTLGRAGYWAGREAGYSIVKIGPDWLVTGRLLDEWERAQRAIERALAVSLLVALLIGAAGGLVLTRYVTRRLDRIAGAVDAVAAGDLGRRVGDVAGGGDAFDRLATRIDGMLDRIDRLMSELRIVTDSVAHDLRSPIARLRTRAEVALTATDEAQRDVALAGLVTETDLVMRMLTTLLEISRAEAGTRDSFALMDPAELVEEIADLYQPAIEEAGMPFQVTLPQVPIGAVRVHRQLLSQAIANLIDNAIRHAGAGAQLTLSLDRERPSGGVRIAVRDTGPGIAQDNRELALKRFGRLDAARSQPGAGLGLALVQAVAHLHGGTLELSDNQPGLAATIVIAREDETA